MPVARPSTANTVNTMCLVVKPKVEEYTNAAPILGSESEREAWRKNRVMQMKLTAYLTEIQSQQQNCARLLKTEEYRFTQEATRRSGVPRSVEMLQQLNFYRQKHFPSARYSFGTSTSRDGLHPHHHGVHRHPPMSARSLRPHRLANGLSRPKTSATIYRIANRNRTDVDEDEDIENIDVATRGLDLLDNASVYNKNYYDNQINRQNEHEQVFHLVDNAPPPSTSNSQVNRFNAHHLRQNSYGATTSTELPAIKNMNLRDSDHFENGFPQDSVMARASTPRKILQSVDPKRKNLNDNNIIRQPLYLPKTPSTSSNRFRTESLSSSNSAMPKYLSVSQKMNSLSKFTQAATSDSLAVLHGKLVETDRESLDSNPYDANTNVNTNLPNHLVTNDNVYNTNDNDNDDVGDDEAFEQNPTTLTNTVPQIPNDLERLPSDDDTVILAGNTLTLTHTSEFPGAEVGAASNTFTNTLTSTKEMKLDSLPQTTDDRYIIDYVESIVPEPEINPIPIPNNEVKATQPKVTPMKTSFNRIRKGEPVMPLRHNITSVLRQERAKFEASQLKVKDYIHKMSLRDTISRSNPREHSAQSRKASARLNDSRTEPKPFNYKR